MMVPIQVIRWYRMQCYDGTDSCAIVVPIRRYCQLRWGKMVMIKDLPFIAAPVMFFGKDYFSIIPKKELLKVPNSQDITIKEQEIISIKLFGLYENPNLHRNSQKKYWKVTSLSQRIKKYKEQTFSIDAISQYKKRYEKMKANHALE